MKRSRLSILVLVLALAGAVSAFAAAVPIQSLWSGLTDNSGQPLGGGRVYFYLAGTTTAADVWDESTKVTARQYVDLDGYGRAVVYGDNIYKIIVRASDTVTTLYEADYYEARSSSNPASQTIASLTVGALTVTSSANVTGLTAPSATLNTPTITGGTITGTTISGGTLTSTTISGGVATFTELYVINATATNLVTTDQTGQTITYATMDSPTITGTGTAVLASATITNLTATTLTVTTLNAAGLTWSGIGIVSPTITGGVITGATINNPTFGGTTGGGTLQSLTLLEGPTVAYPGTAVSDAYVAAQIGTTVLKQAPVGAGRGGGAAATDSLTGSDADLRSFTITNSTATTAYYLVWTRNMSVYDGTGTGTGELWLSSSSGTSYSGNTTALDYRSIALNGGTAQLIPVTLQGVVSVAAATTTTIYLSGHESSGDMRVLYDSGVSWYGYAKVY